MPLHLRFKTVFYLHTNIVKLKFKVWPGSHQVLRSFQFIAKHHYMLNSFTGVYNGRSVDPNKESKLDWWPIRNYFITSPNFLLRLPQGPIPETLHPNPSLFHVTNLVHVSFRFFSNFPKSVHFPVSVPYNAPDSDSSSNGAPLHPPAANRGVCDLLGRGGKKGAHRD